VDEEWECKGPDDTEDWTTFFWEQVANTYSEEMEKYVVRPTNRPDLTNGFKLSDVVKTTWWRFFRQSVIDELLQSGRVDENMIHPHEKWESQDPNDDDKSNWNPFSWEVVAKQYSEEFDKYAVRPVNRPDITTTIKFSDVVSTTWWMKLRESVRYHRNDVVIYEKIGQKYKGTITMSIGIHASGPDSDPEWYVIPEYMWDNYYEKWVTTGGRQKNRSGRGMHQVKESEMSPKIVD